MISSVTQNVPSPAEYVYTTLASFPGSLSEKEDRAWGGGGGGGGGGKAVDFQQLEIGGINQIAATDPCEHMTHLQAFTFTAVLTRNIITL